MVNLTGIIRRRKVADIIVRQNNNLSDVQMSEVRRHMAKRLALIKKKLMSVNPVLYPPGKLPKAGFRYKPMLITGKEAKAKIDPGRLRRSTAVGIKWTGGTGLRGLSPTGTKKVSITWGLGIQELGGSHLPYGAWVAMKHGTATGGGARFQWHIKFRRWLAEVLRKEVLSINKTFKLEGNNRLFFRRAANL